MKPLFVASCLPLFVCLSTAQQTDKPAFAFADRSGTRLLAVEGARETGKNQQRPSYTRAVCPGNAVFTVKFLTYQPRGAKDSGRQVSYNFDQQEGPVFALAGNAKLQPDDVCLLASESFFTGKHFPQFQRRMARSGDATAPAPSCSSTPAWVAAKPGRPVASCWELAHWLTGDLLLVEYQRRPGDLLAALVLHTTGTTFVQEYPAKDEWRVDDEGKLSPEDWRPLFIAESPSGPQLGLEWAGSEGGNEYLLQGSNGRLEEVVHTYLYWVPL